MNIVVLSGGLSPERDVSLSSGSLIANALIDKGHDVYLLDVLIGSEKKFEEITFLNNKGDVRYNFTVPSEEPDLNALKKQYPELIGKNVIDICKKTDIVFIALHGSIGENGQLQSLFDLNSVKYTGSGYIGCMLAMDKDISKKAAKHEGIPTPNWKLFSLDEYTIDQICTEVSVPCVVKPLSCGSSVGITIPKTNGELIQSLQLAQKYEQQVLIEDMITGREFSCGVLDGKALPVIEIIPKQGFYDYKNKYQKGLTSEVCPAEIDQVLDVKIREYSVKIHKALRLGYYSRSDFIVREDGLVFYLETNTLPGMTPTSLLPQEAHVSGISYNELCEQIVCHPC